MEGTGVYPKEGLYNVPVHWDITYKYANGVTVRFSDHNVVNTMILRFKGTKGWIEFSRKSIDAEPKSLLDSVIGPNELHLPRVRHYDRHFLECVRSRSKTLSPVETAHRSTSICYLGNIALQVGGKLRWDPDKERFVNSAEANRLVSRRMRSPWHL